MEYSKKDWQRSEGQYRTGGRESQDKDKKLRAYRPAERENTRENRPNEMLTMESSYGGISLGASRKRKLTMVVHEKRRSRGPGLKQDNRQVEGSRTAKISELRGNFRTNSHSRQDSAFAYEEKLSESPLRMMEQIQEMMDENRQQSGEKVLPFLNRNADRQTGKEIREKLRTSREQDDREGYGLWNEQKDAFDREQTEKAQMRRRFYRELAFAREKSRKLMHRDVSLTEAFFLPETLTADSGAEEEPVEEGSNGEYFFENIEN